MVGKKIKMYLTEKNISQYWLSENAKIALPKLNMSLNGKRKLSAEEFKAIVDALNVDANTFLKQNSNSNEGDEF